METPVSVVVSVVVVAASPIVAAGVRAVLGAHDGIRILSDGGGGSDADVTVYDAWGLDQDDGAELEALCAASSTTVLVIGRSGRPDLAARALVRGAAATFDLDADAEEIVALVTAAAQGGSEFAVSAEERLSGTGLTQREVDVLGAITRGLTNDEVCRELYLGHNTVKSYIRSAYAKIEVTSRSQAVVWCLLHGFDPK